MTRSCRFRKWRGRGRAGACSWAPPLSCPCPTAPIWLAMTSSGLARFAILPPLLLCCCSLLGRCMPGIHSGPTNFTQRSHETMLRVQLASGSMTLFTAPFSGKHTYIWRLADVRYHSAARYHGMASCICDTYNLTATVFHIRGNTCNEPHAGQAVRRYFPACRDASKAAPTGRFPFVACAGR